MKVLTLLLLCIVAMQCCNATTITGYVSLGQSTETKDFNLTWTINDDTITFTASGMVGGADTVSIDWGAGEDHLSFATTATVGVDTLNIGTPIPGGMGEDHISFNSTSRKVTEAKNETEWKDFFKPSKDQPPYYEDDFGLVAGDINLSTEKDDK